jgi:acyl carrier protein
MNVREKVVLAASRVLGVSIGDLSGDASSETIEAWDSLKHMGLMLALEQEFGIRFTDDQIVENLSIEQIVDTVTKLATKAGGAPQR